ncbi:hypothetical protein KIPB_015382, partial [Kipferlia bialata]
STPLLYPNAADLAKGAYSNAGTQYVHDVPSLQGLVAYGKARGVRVVPEYDTPGHAAAWGEGYPGITVQCPSYTQ